MKRASLFPDWLTDWSTIAREWTAWAWQHRWWLMAGYVLVLVLIVTAKWWLYRPRQAGHTVHGSEHWASRWQLWWWDCFNRRGMPLAVSYGRYLRTPLEQNVVLFAPPGEGKTATVIASLIARETADAIVFDPGSELIKYTAPFRRSIGSVYIWEPTSLDTDQINPYDMIDWGTINEVEQLDRLTSHVVSSKGLTTSSGAQHYERVADDVLSTTSLYVAHRYTPPGTTFDEMLDVFSDPSMKLPQLLDDMSQHGHREVRRGAGRLKHKTTQKLQEEWSAATEWLTRWKDPKLAHATARTTIPWRDLQQGPDPITLYLRISTDDASGRLNRVVRMLLDLMVFHLSDREATAYRRDLDFYIDDAGTLGDFPVLDDIAIEKRKYGFRLVVPFQSPAQAWHESGRYAGLLNSCGCWVIFRQNDPDSAKFLEAKLGETTVLTPSDRTTWGRGWARSRGLQAVKRPLFTYGEIQSMAPGTVVACIRHLKAQGRRLDPFRDRTFAPFVGR